MCNTYYINMHAVFMVSYQSRGKCTRNSFGLCIDRSLSPQFALRLLAFRQIHKVLGMDPLPQMNSRFNVRNNRKRRRDNSDGTDGFEAEGKKDKKDYEGF